MYENPPNPISTGISAFNDIETDSIIEIKMAIPINVVTEVYGLLLLSSESCPLAEIIGNKIKTKSTLKRIYVTMIFVNCT